MKCSLCGEWQDTLYIKIVERLGATTIAVCAHKKLCMMRALQNMTELSQLNTIQSAFLTLVAKDA